MTATSPINPEYLEKIEKLRLLDDDFMCAVFDGDGQAVKEILVPILGRDDFEVADDDVHVQDSYQNLKGHSVRLDVTAKDSTGKRYDIEIQRADYGAGQKRARYNLGLMDAHILKKGQEYNDLPEVFVIFITENDVLRKGLPIYHIERIVQETGELFDDSEHIIYVNAKYEGDEPIGRLMSDFRATRADDINSAVLADRVRNIKETEEGQKAMCKMFEDERAQGAMNAIAKMVVQKVITLVQGRKAAVDNGLSESEFDDFLRKNYPTFVFPM
jgi:predicted transposase/invertase (TIGR01784 family)